PSGAPSTLLVDTRPHPPGSPLFPYTTLFRSLDAAAAEAGLQDALEQRVACEEALAQARRELDDIAATLRGADENRMRLEQSLEPDRKSTRLNSSHVKISYAVFCLKKKKNVTD